MRKLIVLFLLVAIGVGTLFYLSGNKESTIEKSQDFDVSFQGLVDSKLGLLRENGIDVRVEGKSISSFNYEIKLGEDAKLYAPKRFLEDIMCCSVNEYPDGTVKMDRGRTTLEFKKNELLEEEGVIYIPISDHLKDLGYMAEYSFASSMVNFINIDDGHYLPDAYDMRDYGRVSPVRDQGNQGTCWAFASLGALETITLPQEEMVYSVDHMSLNNGFSLDLSEGGEHTMSIAYMAAWRGPVLEEDDPYGDGETDESLTAVKHLKEAIIINERDDNKIKSAIYKYGGVETSIYLEMPYGESYSVYYNPDTASYYYDGYGSVANLTAGADSISYTYDMSGIRSSKNRINKIRRC